MAPYQEIVAAFNSICTDLPRVIQITDARKTAIKNRIKEAGGKDQLIELFKTVHQNDFLSGRSGNWKASFDWIMKAGNFVKIREGNYQNRAANGRNQNGSQKAIEEGTREWLMKYHPEELEKLEERESDN